MPTERTQPLSPSVVPQSWRKPFAGVGGPKVAPVSRAPKSRNSHYYALQTSKAPARGAYGGNFPKPLQEVVLSELASVQCVQRYSRVGISSNREVVTGGSRYEYRIKLEGERMISTHACSRNCQGLRARVRSTPLAIRPQRVSRENGRLSTAHPSMMVTCPTATPQCEKRRRQPPPNACRSLAHTGAGASLGAGMYSQYELIATRLLCATG